MRPEAEVVGVQEGVEEWVRSQWRVVDITARRQRPWANVWRVTGPDGVWWLKVNSPLTGYETRLWEFFRLRSLALVPPSITHPTEPWALVRDAGRSAEEHLRPASREDVVAFWVELLPRYAELQKSMASADLVALGVPDLSGSDLVQEYDQLLSEPQWFRMAIAPDYSPAVHQRVVYARSQLVSMATELSEGIAPTVQHDDLHEGNVFTSAAGQQIIDWGDAVVAHPFSTLRVTLDVLAARLQVESDDPVLRPVTEAYLEVWLVGGESRAELHRQLDLALRVAGLGRALGWARALGRPQAGEALGFADAVASWMTRFADDVLGPATDGDV